MVVSREGRDGALRVNDEEAVVGTSPGPASQLNLQMRLYVGGVPGQADPSSGVITGFVGAVQRVCRNMLCGIFMTATELNRILRSLNCSNIVSVIVAMF